MSARDFLRRQLTDDERSKLGALPTNDALDLLLGGRQPLNSSLTTLSSKTIGTKGLDLLASSTSAAAINALGGSAGLIVSGMITSLDAVKLTGTVDLDRLPTIPNAKISDLDAAKLTGTIDVARLPVIPGNNSLSATSIAGLTTLQQAAVSLGTMVYTADGGAWRYSGSGSKTAEASYYYTADVTPEWNAIANKPALATAAQGALADTALQAGASAEVLTEGATKKLLTATERTKLAGIATGATANATDASLRDRTTHTGLQEMATISGLVAALSTYAQVAGPTADLGADLGQASRRYGTAYLSALQLGGNSQVNTSLHINGAAGSDRQVRFKTAGVDIWTLLADNSPQSGGNAGSDLLLLRRSDAGAQLGTAFRVSRATGLATFEVRPSVSGAGLVETQNNKGAANGYAGLGADGLVPSSQLPVNGSYKGSWNANTNTPTITAGVGANGDEYTVSVAGTNSITGTSTAWSVGDRAKFTTNGNKWERIPSVQAVNSVNGQTGIVVLAKSDVGLGNVDNTSDANKPVSTAQQTALNLKANTASPALTGTPTAPTAALGTNTDQIATMAALKAGLDASNFDTLDGGAI
ncbi:hypothetical protein [Neorhizobium sp. AL 9.2.2]|uniref:hypothetical protein n=1 Tax=Neorhizobium sp. AL 9.2.2 TaxID=2712894 RepID=UPI0015747AAE|nr:hypothetical protein [Neorhizobium sp. AL 9.2.2]NSY17272.1 hypothetical protein [Neorhizobium sp. AL 9.2.2]